MHRCTVLFTLIFCWVETIYELGSDDLKLNSNLMYRKKKTKIDVYGKGSEGVPAARKKQ